MNHEAAFFQALTSTAKEYIRKLGIQSVKEWDEAGPLQTEEFTSFIQVSGVIEGGFIFSVEKELAYALVTRYVLDELIEEEIPDFAVEVVAEISNIISGNSLIDREENDITLGNPLMIVAKQADIKPKSDKTCVARFMTEYGKFQCLYIPMDKNAELASILAVRMD